MTFDDILDQITTLLKRQGRVSYRALKMRFNLDDEYLDVLKEELLYVHPVRDDEGRGLVWAGTVEETVETPAPPPQSIPAPSTQETPPIQPESPSRTSHAPEAERRQLTVMFCDLVDSTKLSSQLDPEEYRNVVRAYQQMCSELITHFDGHIAQLLGDGLPGYFGYPQAHEDDVQRAVRTGLGILAAMEDLNTRLPHAKGITLAVRLGIHTGLVVIGAMGDQGRHEQLALGETPNVAARLQGLAASNTVVISDTSYRLVQGYFACQDLGAQTLRGVAQPLKVYRVLGASGVYSRLDVAQTRGLTPLVDLFQRILRFEAHETPDVKLEKLAHALSQYRLPLEEFVPLFAPLLALPVPENRYPPLNLSSQRQRQKTLETIVAILQELAEHQPVLFILEDLHWTDPSTLELIGLLLDQTPTASMLVLLTCRPHFQPAWHHRSYLTEITVNRLSQPQIERMTIHIAGGKTVPDQVMQLIVENTDGVPLFVEELTKAILESDYLKETGGHYALAGALSSLAIPTTLQDSLMARLDRLVSAKGIAQLGAAIGRQFAYDLLHAVSQ